jgi:ribosome biogenesis GTPase / thiamine phosphate phosphatase
VQVKGQIIKGVGGLYTIKLDNKDIVKCKARGKLRAQGDLYIGDIVEASVDKKGEGVIEKVLPRTSKMIRPYVSNIDGIIIVLSPIPEPNFLLVDKLIIGAIAQHIMPIICVNKPDLAGFTKLVEQVKHDYSSMAKILEIDALSGKGSEELKALVKGKFYALCGQSAVGKSTFVNKMIGKEIMEVGELSKNDKGKNTTRHIEIITLEDGTKIADTCGFEKLEMPVSDPNDLASYFVDFDEFLPNCKFKMCRHVDEEVCGVKAAVNAGLLSKDRYDRYLQIYKDSLKRWNKRYD